MPMQAAAYLAYVVQDQCQAQGDPELHHVVISSSVVVQWLSSCTFDWTGKIVSSQDHQAAVAELLSKLCSDINM